MTRKLITCWNCGTEQYATVGIYSECYHCECNTNEDEKAKYQDFDQWDKLGVGDFEIEHVKGALTKMINNLEYLKEQIDIIRGVIDYDET